MGEKLPTPREILEKANISSGYWSVAYRESRSILNAKDRPVLAYGLGYGGGLLIMLDGHNFVKAYSFSVVHPANYGSVNFSTVSETYALRQIRDNKFFIYREEDKKALEKHMGKERKKPYEPPLVCEVSYRAVRPYWGGQPDKDGFHTTDKIKLYRYKNGMLFGQRSYGRMNEREFWLLWERVKKNHRVNKPGKKDTQATRILVDLPADIEKEIKQRCMINEL